MNNFFIILIICNFSAIVKETKRYKPFLLVVYFPKLWKVYDNWFMNWTHDFILNFNNLHVVMFASFCHQGADRAVPVLIIGILVFLPGFYHLRIAYYASKGYRGYSYDDIPDFDD